MHMKIKHADRQDAISKEVRCVKTGCERVPRFDKGKSKPKTAMACTLSGVLISDSEEEKKLIKSDTSKLLEEQKELSFEILKNGKKLGNYMRYFGVKFISVKQVALKSNLHLGIMLFM